MYASIRNALLFSVAVYLWSQAIYQTSHAQIERTLAIEGKSAQLQCVYLTNDQKYAIGHGTNDLVVWELSSGKEVYHSNSYIEKVLFDSRGNRLLYFNNEQQALNTIVLNASPDQWKVEKVPGRYDYLQLLKLSRDGRMLAAKGEGGLLVIDLTTRRTIIRKPIEDIADVAFSPDNSTMTLAFYRDQQAVVSYSLSEGTKTADSAAFLSGAAHLTYSPNGQSIAVSCVMGGKNGVAIVDGQKLRPVRGATILTSQSPEYVHCVWSSDGARLVLTGALDQYDGLSIVDTSSFKVITSLRGSRCNWVTVDNSAERLFTTSNYDPGVIIWDWQAALRIAGPDKTLATHPVGSAEDGYKSGLSLVVSPDEKSFLVSLPRLENYQGGKLSMSRADKSTQIDFGRMNRAYAHILMYDFDAKALMAMSSNTREFREPDGDELGGERFQNLRYAPDGKSLACLFGFDYDKHLGCVGHDRQKPARSANDADRIQQLEVRMG